MIEDIEDVSNLPKVRLGQHRRITMKGLYFREMLKRIQKTKRIKQSTLEETPPKEIETNNQSPLSEEGNFLDKTC